MINVWEKQECLIVGVFALKNKIKKSIKCGT
jgi:hypothetical protein